MIDTDVISSELAALLARIESEPAPPFSRQPRVMLTLRGMTMSRKAWAHHARMSEDVLRKRLLRGMTLEEAVTTGLSRVYTGSPVGDIVREAKDRPCKDCGIKYHQHAMEFDHVRGKKLFDISKAESYGRQKVQDEIAKCDVVCANCHRIRTAARRRA